MKLITILLTLLVSTSIGCNHHVNDVSSLDKYEPEYASGNSSQQRPSTQHNTTKEHSQMSNKLYGVYHFAFATDDLKLTTTYVSANSKEEALAKYNIVALTRTEYPYCWHQAKLESVYEIKPEIE